MQLDPKEVEELAKTLYIRALKLLLIWRRDSRREERVELARRFGDDFI